MQEHPFPGQCVSKDAHRIKSCDFCRLKNRKCDRTEYCLRCRNKGIPCIYSKNSTSSKAYRELKKKLKYGEVGMSRQSEGARSTSSPNPPASTISEADGVTPKSATQHSFPHPANPILPSSAPLPHSKVSLGQASSGGPSATSMMSPSGIFSPNLSVPHAQQPATVQQTHFAAHGHSVHFAGQDLTRQLSTQSDKSHCSNMTSSSAYTNPHFSYEQLHSQHPVQQQFHYIYPPEAHSSVATSVEAKNSDSPLTALADVCVTELKLPSFSSLMQHIERQRATF